MRRICPHLFILLFFPISALPAPSGPSTIEIGFIAPLTGSYSDWGNKVRNGFLLALEDTERKFMADIEDDGSCEPRKAVTAVQKMISLKGIKIIVGPGCLSNLKAVAPIAAGSGVVLFSTGLLDDEATRISNNVISWATQISVEARYLAKYLESEEYRTVAVIHSSDAFGQEFRDRLPEALNSYRIKASPIEQVSLEESDFRPLIARVIRSSSDAIFLNLGEFQLATFAKQLRASGSSLPLFSGYPAEADSTLKAGGAAVEGLTYTYQIIGEENSKAKVRFDRRYRERFGDDPGSTSYFVYDGMMQLDRALGDCAGNDTRCLLSYFHALGTTIGVSGSMRFFPDGTVERAYGIKRIIDGKFVWVTRDLKL